MSANQLARVLLCTVAISNGCTGVLAANRPPTERDLVGKDGEPRVVLLLRVVSEVDGELGEPFRGAVYMDNISFGIAGFETGMGVKRVVARYLSGETRKAGWAFLLVRPGLHYLAISEPQSSNDFDYAARLKTCPRWRVEIPAVSRVHYAGTFFLPGKGSWQIWGPRAMVAFDESRIEVRDESVLAVEICTQFLPSLAPVSIQMAELHKPGDTMIIETPPGK